MSKTDIQLKQQQEVISYLYQYELLGGELSVTKAFEENDYSKQSLEQIEKISKVYPKLKVSIEKNLKGWTWSRLEPLVRAILVYGSFEMIFKDSKMVINGMVMLTKAYIPNDKYKFVNAILDKIGADYEQIKTNKK